jgi:hypothetical protein
MIPFAFVGFLGLFAISSAEIDGLGTDARASAIGTTSIAMTTAPAINNVALKSPLIRPAAAPSEIDVVNATAKAEAVQPAPTLMTAKKEVIENSDPTARTAMKFGKDDEKSDDWIK